MVVLDFYPMGSSRWIVALSQIPEGLRVICMDRPGIGLSSSAEHSTPMLFADDVANVLDQMGVSKVHVLACCCGAIYGLAFAVRHPSRVTGVSLLAPWVEPDLASASLRFVKHHVPQGIIGAVGWLTNHLVLASFSSVVESTLLPSERAKLRPALVAASRAVCEENGRRTADGNAADLAACAGKTPWGYTYADAAAAAAAGRRQILVVAGTHDTVVRPGAVCALAAALPGCALEWVEASHTGLIMLQRPEVLRRILDTEEAAAAAAVESEGRG